MSEQTPTDSKWEKRDRNVKQQHKPAGTGLKMMPWLNLVSVTQLQCTADPHYTQSVNAISVGLPLFLLIAVFFPQMFHLL